MKATTTELERVRRAGYLAYYANQTAAECPHPEFTPQMYAWVRGHNEAEAEVEEAHGPNGAMLLPMDPPGA